MVATQEQAREQTLGQRALYVGLVAVALLIVGAIWVLGGGRFGEAADQSTTVTMAGGQGGVAPRIGEPAPEFTVETMDGRTLTLAELRGRPVLINFWATWCPPCRGEMPDLESVSREYRDAGLVVLAVNLQEDRGAIQRYAETLGLTLSIVLDRSGAVAGRYNLTALPTSYFVDREGVVRDLNVGALTAKSLRTKVAKVMQ